MSFWHSGHIILKEEELSKSESFLIKPFKRERAKQCSYELSLGREVFISSEEEKQFVKVGETITIPPGQFAMLLTEETVNIPDTVLAFLSIKAKIKLQGLVNVSGFHVDPGYNGKLLFSVYNAGNVKIRLDRLSPVFLIWFADIKDQATPTPYTKAGKKHIEAGVMSCFQNEMASPASLKQQLDDMERELTKNFEKLEHDLNAKYTRLEKIFWYSITTLLGLLVLASGLRSFLK